MDSHGAGPPPLRGPPAPPFRHRGSPVTRRKAEPPENLQPKRPRPPPDPNLSHLPATHHGSRTDHLEPPKQQPASRFGLVERWSSTRGARSQLSANGQQTLSARSYLVSRRAAGVECPAALRSRPYHSPRGERVSHPRLTTADNGQLRCGFHNRCRWQHPDPDPPLDPDLRRRIAHLEGWRARPRATVIAERAVDA
jgi:hypothetical protein